MNNGPKPFDKLQERRPTLRHTGLWTVIDTTRHGGKRQPYEMQWHEYR